MTNNEVKFDPSCGISEEEQREIFTQINGIAEKNRKSLAAAADDDGQKKMPHHKMRHPANFKAKKSGSLFPILVNAAAALALAGGFIVLSGSQGKTDAQVREGTRVYNTAERALIQEIRKDTSAEENDFALSEMERLSREQAQTATVEAQMSALFANLNYKINQNQFDDAAEIIRGMKNFIDTPSFHNIRSIQARRDFYIQTIDSCEKMLAAARRGASSGAMTSDSGDSEQLASLQKEKEQLERDIAEKDRSINALKKDNSAAERISELESSLSTLRSLNTTLEANSNERREQVRTLENANTALERTVASNTTTINKIKQVVQVEKSIDDMTFNEIKESLIRIQDALGN